MLKGIHVHIFIDIPNVIQIPNREDISGTQAKYKFDQTDETFPTLRKV